MRNYWEGGGETDFDTPPAHFDPLPSPPLAPLIMIVGRDYGAISTEHSSSEVIRIRFFTDPEPGDKKTGFDGSGSAFSKLYMTETHVPTIRFLQCCFRERYIQNLHTTEKKNSEIYFNNLLSTREMCRNHKKSVGRRKVGKVYFAIIIFLLIKNYIY